VAFLKEPLLDIDMLDAYESLKASSFSLLNSTPKLFSYLIPFFSCTSPLTPIVGGNSMNWSPSKNNSLANVVSVPPFVFYYLSMSLSTSSYVIVNNSSDS
jgi:hypothetical protein